jgi:hypothetical protein
MKAIRQDLTLQNIKDAFAAEVYETHARLALENRDYSNYKQCQVRRQTSVLPPIRVTVMVCCSNFVALVLHQPLLQASLQGLYAEASLSPRSVLSQIRLVLKQCTRSRRTCRRRALKGTQANLQHTRFCTRSARTGVQGETCRYVPQLYVGCCLLF